MKLSPLASGLLLAASASAFYLPGVAPNSYQEGDNVALLVNHITPSLRKEDDEAKTYLYSYDYYFERFHFCQPKEGLKHQSESLGSVLFGDRIFNSPFQMNVLQNVTCEALCETTYPAKDGKFFNKNIASGFQHNWLVDGLPVARTLEDTKTGELFYSQGFNIGFEDDNKNPFIYNHYEIYVEYHLRSDGTYRVVGSYVNPRSIQYADGEADCTLADSPPLKLSEQEDTKVKFTYSVYWVPSETPWATRWDKYLHVYDPNIQWFALVNFAVVVLILSFIMSHVLITNVKKDLQKYNNLSLDDDIVDEMGWKLIYGDVFRAPKNPMLLSILVGSGMQMLLMALTTCFFALLGLLSPSNRGSLSTVMFVLYSVYGFVGSYFSAYIYKFFKGEDWKVNMILTPLLVPGFIFSVFIFLNFFLVFAQSSGAVPLGTMVAIVAIWFIISVPLSCLGSLMGIRRGPIEIPVKVNQIPRQIPPQPWYKKTPAMVMVAGIFPFGAISIELYFIFTSIWFNRIYYMFGFLFFCVVLMLFTSCLVTLLLTYFSLCNENYKWQWKSFLLGSGVSVYVFLHSLFLSKMSLGNLTSIVLYVGYSSVISLGVGVMCGSAGFLASMYLTLNIYRQLRVD